MGIGVNTGEVVVGNIGSHKRAKYGVVGSPVNLTARIESYAVGGQVLISEATRQAIGPLLSIAKHLEVNAKGLETPVAVYDVRGIGGAYNLLLPEPADVMIALAKELHLKYTVLEDKHLGEAVYTGSLATLSARGGELRSAQAVALWSDLKIYLLDDHDAAVTREFYAKVMRRLPGDVPGFYVHFTYMPLEGDRVLPASPLLAWLMQTCGRWRQSVPGPGWATGWAWLDYSTCCSGLLPPSPPLCIVSCLTRTKSAYRHRLGLPNAKAISSECRNRVDRAATPRLYHPEIARGNWLVMGVGPVAALDKSVVVPHAHHGRGVAGISGAQTV
jgi:hypothetical protein